MITIWKTPIVATVEQVLKDLKLQLYGAGLLKEIKNTGSDLMCTCPFHANGKEHKRRKGGAVEEIRKVLLSLKEKGKLIILASHSKEDIQILCDTVFRMDHGKIIATETN